MHILIKIILTHRTYLTKKVMESNNILKPKSSHIHPSHFQSNETASTPLNMGEGSNSRVKATKQARGDKENLNPNRRTLAKTLGDHHSDERTMINQNKVNGEVAENRSHKGSDSKIAVAREELHVHEKSKTSVDEIAVALKELHVYEKSIASADSSVPHSQSPRSKVIPQSYVDAIKQLNTLQSNVKALKVSRATWDSAKSKAMQVDQVLHYLGHLNVTADDIRQLRFIHISGTKGKGSTSAYCESILRAHGFSTGFFSSPHLIEVRERIKLNGQPIGYELFTKYFWTVYNALHEKRSHPDDMPAYFKFLTVMSFYVFVKERPDVCIMEVGIGGLYDNTNIIPNTDVVGITSLGLDHTAVLGNTMEQIASQKAGIMKPGCFAVTAAQQKDACKRVLLDTSCKMDCVLLEAPDILHYDWRGQAVDEDWKSTVQSINISLAIQLAYLWMFRMNKAGEWKTVLERFLTGVSSNSQQRKLLESDSNRNCSHQFGQTDPNRVENFEQTSNNVSLPTGLHFEIDPKTYRGIRECVWPGRMQVVKKNNIKYFLDGAHTSDSIALCSQWFQKKSQEEGSKTQRNHLNRLNALTELKDSNNFNQQSSNSDHSIHRILVFNLTGNRDPAILLPPLIQHNRFDYILVTPNLLTNELNPDIQYGGNRTVDRYDNIPIDSAKNSNLAENRLKNVTGAVTDRIRSTTVSSFNSADSCNNTLSLADNLTGVQKIASVASALSSHAHTQVIAFDNVLNTYNFKRRLDPAREYHVLVTGSLHLVGAFLNVLTNYE